MQEINTLKSILEREGFKHVYEWKDKPNETYESHSHKGKVAMYILDGGITFIFDDTEVSLAQGDRFDVPIGKEHTAVVSNEGGHYVIGEMIEGDT